MLRVSSYPYRGGFECFSCQIQCQQLHARQHQDVTISFPDLARELVQVRWVMCVGDVNLDENDDGYRWDDNEYPNAVGVYLKGRGPGGVSHLK
eukprot:12417591-Karenia_brevis.AAC.1